MSLDDVTTPADQEFELCEDVNGELEYPVRAAKFSGALVCAHIMITGFRHQSSVLVHSALGGRRLHARLLHRSARRTLAAHVTSTNCHRCVRGETDVARS